MDGSNKNNIITEALAAEGYKKVIPAFYEMGLNAKYDRDMETSEMLEIISGSRWFDFGYCQKISTDTATVLPGRTST